ncbi:MAG: MarR family transcriptional regulator, partial [Polyangiaceae bacterium]|nr:MarR family transcriptional regulator [Polyangiaceae bacterium]
NKLFQGFGITSQQYNVLRVLYVRSSSECGLRCSDIAERMLNREPDMTRLLDRLEKAELLSRDRCTHDRRVVWIQLTDKGFDLVEEIQPLLSAFHKERFKAFSAEELATLRGLLEKLAGTCCTA